MKEPKHRDGKVYVLFGAFILFLIAAKIGYAYVTYGDWSCAFANCVKVEPVK